MALTAKEGKVQQIRSFKMNEKQRLVFMWRVHIKLSSMFLKVIKELWQGRGLRHCANRLPQLFLEHGWELG